MNKDLSSYRKSYEKSELSKDSVDNNPFVQFKIWFEEVDAEYPEFETNAMTLSTFGEDGYPRNRVVLLKEINNDGFIFYTNYNSQKGRAIENNNNVCISFFWREAERQIIIKGEASKISEEKSDTYFRTRPKGSQLGALASDQSEVIPDKKTLTNKLEALKTDYQNSDIPRPDDWGGYLISPIEFEFWQGRPNRLHDRIRYTNKEGGSWKIDRLSP